MNEALPVTSHDLRYCQTHAFAACLFAVHPRHHSNRETWAYVARAWADLADLKERTGRISVKPATAHAKPPH